MFKNIVFVIIFVAVYAFVGFYFASNPNNDSSDYSNGGSIVNSVYQNTKCGFSIDLSEDWVYFTPNTVDQLKAAQYGVNMSEVENGTVLLGFAKPDRSVVCAKMNEAFTARDLNLDSLRELAYYTAVYLEESGFTVYDYDAGLISTGSEVYYYSIDCDYGEERTSLIYVLFNTDKDTSMLICGYYPMGEKDSFISFIEKNLKVTKDAGNNIGTSM